MRRCCVPLMPSSSSSREVTVEILESYTFRAVSYPWRLHVGGNALCHLADEVRRTKAQLGTLYAGVFGAMDKDSSWPAVQKGLEAARAAGADLLIAVGGGSVI